MPVNGFHLMCLADPEPASSVLSTTHLPKPCSHIIYQIVNPILGVILTAHPLYAPCPALVTQ